LTLSAKRVAQKPSGSWRPAVQALARGAGPDWPWVVETAVRKKTNKSFLFMAAPGRLVGVLLRYKNN